MTTPGTLDPTFGTNGKFAATTTNPLTTIVQPDGKTISLATGVPPTGGIAIQRFNTNGSLDSTFGSSGTIDATFELGSTAAGVRQMDDGSILLIREAPFTIANGLALSQLKVTKYNSSGALDISFATGGTLTSASSFIGFLDSAKTVMPVGNKILIVGAINNNARGGVVAELYNKNGTSDNAFGTNGRVTIDESGMRSGGISTALLRNDGRIVIAGPAGVFGLRASGSSDIFSTPGGIGGTPRLFQQRNGKIIIGGGAGNIIRLNADGTIDNTFSSISNNGPTILQNDDKIVVGTYEDGDFKVRRYSANGVLDATFGTNGLATVDFGGADVIKRLDFANDGRIFASGTDTNKVLSTAIFTGTNAPANRPPVVENPIADQNATIGTVFSFVVPANTFSDPDVGDNPIYFATLGNDSALPSWLTFNPTTRTFSGTPPIGTAGSLILRVRATDKNGQLTTNNFNLNISGSATAPNQAPVLANPIADQNATIGSVFNFTIPANAFSDPNSDPLTYTSTLADGSNTPLPSWLTFDANTRTFAGTPPTGTGNLNLRVRATDNGGLSLADDFTLTIASSGGAGGGTTPLPPITGVRRITQAPNGTGSDGRSRDAAISNDGRYVVYRSEASNLVANDPNGGGSSGGDIFLYDRDTNANTRIAEGFTPDISGNGRYITYNDQILDRDTNTTTTFVKAIGGAAPIGSFGAVSRNASISDDGRYIAYYSFASNLVSNDTNNNSDIFLFDRQAETTIKVSSGAGFSTVPQIAGDGSFIVYGTDENSVYLYDRITGTNTKISPDDFGTANIKRAHISSDNRYITFGNQGSVNKTLKYDRQTGTITNGDPDLIGDFAIITSGDGNYQVRLAADSANLVPNDNNGFDDFFLFATGNNSGSGGTGGTGGGGSPSGGSPIVLLADNFNAENGGTGKSAYPATSLANWNITRGTVDIIGTDFSGREYISGRGSYLDLDGNTFNAGKIESKNTFSFAADEEITLKFFLAGSQRSALLPAGQDNDSVTVSLGNLFNETFTRSGSSPFEQITRTFKVNTATNAKLIFDHAGSDNIGLLLDDVELSKTAGGNGGNNTIIPGLSLAGNLFQTDSSFKGFGIAPVSQKLTQKVSEIALFAVDDLAGKIGSLTPGQAGYLTAVLQNAKSVFSTLSGSFFSTDKRELVLDPNKFYQALEIVDGSLLDAQQLLASGKTPTNLLFSLPDSSGNSPVKITSTTNGYNLSINNDELVLAIDKLAGTLANIPIGAKSQSLAEGRTIDLTDYVGQTLKADVVTKSSAAYNNQVGFYAVEDAIGTIKLANGSTLKPGDINYAQEAIKLALTNSLQAGKTDSFTGKDIIGGKIYAPVVVAQGTLNDFLTKNPTNGGGADVIHAYFNYLGANPDKVDHFRSIGNNTFGVEDLYGGGDRDFNDLVIKMDLKV
jgi:uncharacterized delta-60 repeat protein